LDLLGSIYKSLDRLDPAVDKSPSGSVTKTSVYYPAAGGMRVNGTLYYMLKDHLGSASVVTDANGNVVGEQRYYPYGETRFTTGSMYTDKLFTGQREVTGLGIYHYQARFYSPKLGRFLSPDTIIPSFANPQSLNRYMYVLGNPVRYVDPTGHLSCNHANAAEEGCGDFWEIVETEYGITFSGQWKDKYKRAVYDGVRKVGVALARETDMDIAEAFKATYDNITFKWEQSAGMCGDDLVNAGGCTDGAHQIRFWSMSGHLQNDLTRMVKNVIHELGHAYDRSLGRPSSGMSSDFTRDRLLRPNLKTSEGQRWDWQQSPDTAPNEVFADMFIAWTYDAWNTDPKYATDVLKAQSWMMGLIP
jgi:RHS repeat-associated protein